MTATPVDELRAAAQTLRKLTDDATPGPWHRPLNTRYKATVTAALPEGERGAWLDGIDPDTGERERCTVAMVPTRSNGKHSRQRGGRDLEYIAAMDPGVGAALAKLLREVHALHEPKRCPDATDDCHCAGCDWCGDEDWPCSDVRNALAVARRILGGQP